MSEQIPATDLEAAEVGQWVEHYGGLGDNVSAWQIARSTPKQLVFRWRGGDLRYWKRSGWRVGYDDPWRVDRIQATTAARLIELAKERELLKLAGRAQVAVRAVRDKLCSRTPHGALDLGEEFLEKVVSAGEDLLAEWPEEKKKMGEPR